MLAVCDVRANYRPVLVAEGYRVRNWYLTFISEKYRPWEWDYFDILITSLNSDQQVAIVIVREFGSNFFVNGNLLQRDHLVSCVLRLKIKWHMMHQCKVYISCQFLTKRSLTGRVQFIQRRPDI